MRNACYRENRPRMVWCSGAFGSLVRNTKRQTVKLTVPTHALPSADRMNERMANGGGVMHAAHAMKESSPPSGCKPAVKTASRFARRVSRTALQAEDLVVNMCRAKRASPLSIYRGQYANHSVAGIQVATHRDSGLRWNLNSKSDLALTHSITCRLECSSAVALHLPHVSPSVHILAVRV